MFIIGNILRSPALYKKVDKLYIQLNFIAGESF